jgi:hypothetical protein
LLSISANSVVFSAVLLTQWLVFLAVIFLLPHDGYLGEYVRQQCGCL